MAYERVLDVDPLTGQQIVYYHEEGKVGQPDRIALETKCDVTALIEQNKREYNAEDHSAKKFQHTDLRKIASISFSQFIDMEKQGIITRAGKILSQKKLMAWISDPANSSWRTMAGDFRGHHRPGDGSQD